MSIKEPYETKVLTVTRNANSEKGALSIAIN